MCVYLNINIYIYIYKSNICFSKQSLLGIQHHRSSSSASAAPESQRTKEKRETTNNRPHRVLGCRVGAICSKRLKTIACAWCHCGGITGCECWVTNGKTASGSFNGSGDRETGSRRLLTDEQIRAAAPGWAVSSLPPAGTVGVRSARVNRISFFKKSTDWRDQIFFFKKKTTGLWCQTLNRPWNYSQQVVAAGGYYVT